MRESHDCAQKTKGEGEELCVSYVSAVKDRRKGIGVIKFYMALLTLHIERT
ncbi:hypothetical protein MHI57_13780 [Cytobacillus sp. FSL K6-0129]